VGNGKEIPNLKKLVDNLHLSKQVIFHGFKTGDELDSLFNSCHIAVGSLGLHVE
jgi:glycosyltransferase involved in cell wall biosynthesis